VRVLCPAMGSPWHSRLRHTQGRLNPFANHTLRARAHHTGHITLSASHRAHHTEGLVEPSPGLAHHTKCSTLGGSTCLAQPGNRLHKASNQHQGISIRAAQGIKPTSGHQHQGCARQTWVAQHMSALHMMRTPTLFAPARSMCTQTHPVHSCSHT